MDLEILKQTNPVAAAFIDHWRSRYQRVYDFSKEEERANYYEGVQEVARFIASNSEKGVLNIVPNTRNVDHLVVASG